MALTKEVINDKIEVVGEFKAVQCREATVIKENGVEISRSLHRYVLHSSNLVKKNEDGTFVHIDTDISGEPAETQAICNAVWTDDIKAARKTFEEENTRINS